MRSVAKYLCVCSAIGSATLLASTSFSQYSSHQTMPPMQPTQPSQPPQSMPPMQPIQPMQPMQPMQPAVQPVMVPQEAASLVAMTGNETVDAQLRNTALAVKQLLQRSGYRDVEQGRLNQALSAGPSAVQALRTTLGLGCVVRVDVKAHDAFGVALLATVDTESGEQTVNVQASLMDVTNQVVAAVTPLIPPAKMMQQHTQPQQPMGPPLPPVTDPLYAEQVALDRLVLMDGRMVRGVVMGVQAGQSVTIRMQGGAVHTFGWNEIKRIDLHGSDSEDGEGLGPGAATGSSPMDWSGRGGLKLTLDLRGQLMGVYGRVDHRFRVVYNDGQHMDFTGKSPAGGGGLGLGFQLGGMYFGVPEHEEKTLWGVRAGVGVDVGYGAFVYRTDNETQLMHIQNGVIVKPGEQVGGLIEVQGAWMIGVPLFIGFQVGSAPTDSMGVRRGWMLGFDWRPTYTYTKSSSVQSLSFFNYAGMQANFDMVSMRADGGSLEPQFRVSLTYLPQIGDNATYGMVGFGAAWY